jgi:haloalkane dehalogenase
MDAGSADSPARLYAQAQLQRYRIEDATVGVRVFGQGPAVVLIHGYPVHGYTWRKLLPTLAQAFTCYVVDLPGLGDSDWSTDTDFSFTAQARRLGLLFARLNLKDYAIIAHDTGATLARLVALAQPDQVKKLALINTEMPQHRPPWIPFYQWCARLPRASRVFQTLLRSPSFLRSSLGLGQFYTDPALFREEHNIAPYIDPLTTSAKRIQGMLGYLLGIQWSVVDGLQSQHGQLSAQVLLLWGEDDKTFPVELAEAMTQQFRADCVLIRISRASLLPHEEQPAKVLGYLMPFLLAVPAAAPGGPADAS